MIERGQHTGFELESRHVLAVATENVGKELDSNAASELRVCGLIHITHATRSKMCREFVMCEPRADHGMNELAGILSNCSHVTHLSDIYDQGRGENDAQCLRNRDPVEVKAPAISLVLTNLEETH